MWYVCWVADYRANESVTPVPKVVPYHTHPALNNVAG